METLARIGSFWACLICLVLATTGCATENYRKATQAVGVVPADLATKTYSVGVRANDTVVSEFIMRRCAEFTLEQAKRYFKARSHYHGGSHVWSPATGFLGGNKGDQEKVTISLLDQEEPDSFDSVMIIKETNAAARNDLSAQARATMAKFDAGVR